MKKLFFCIVLVTFLGSLSANVYTVSNNNQFPAQYSDIASAMSAASAGDTLYVYGSATNYGNITVTRKLVFIGPGHNPQNEGMQSAQLGTVTLNSGSSGTVINGFQFPSGQIVLGVSGIDDVIIENNSIYNAGSSGHLIYVNNDSDNWIIRGNILYNNYAYSGGEPSCIILNSNSDNVLVQNNVFMVHSSYDKYAIHSSNASTTVINNIFMMPNYIFFNCSFSIFSNNIFLSTTETLIDFNSGCNNCTYNNNITWSAYAESNALELDTIPNGSNFGANNLNNTNPDFVNVPNISVGFQTSYNYQLNETSSGYQYGLDGTDVGLYGGTFDFSKYGHPDLPRIYQMNIYNSVLYAGDSIRVNVKATTVR